MKWIKCSERLPEEGQMIVVMCVVETKKPDSKLSLSTKAFYGRYNTKFDIDVFYNMSIVEGTPFSDDIVWMAAPDFPVQIKEKYGMD